MGGATAPATCTAERHREFARAAAEHDAAAIELDKENTTPNEECLDPGYRHAGLGHCRLRTNHAAQTTKHVREAGRIVGALQGCLQHDADAATFRRRTGNAVDLQRAVHFDVQNCAAAELVATATGYKLNVVPVDANTLRAYLRLVPTDATTRVELLPISQPMTYTRLTPQ